MKYCDKCKVAVRGVENRCPLCQHQLEGESDEQIYPVIIPVYKQYELFFKWIVLISISVGVVSMAINLMIPESGFWSLFVVIGVCFFWAILALGIRKSKNIPKNIVYQSMMVSVFCVIWDLLSDWSGWSINFVFPIVCVLAMAAMMIVAKVMQIATRDFITCLLADAVFGIIPIVLYFTGLLTVYIPAIICSAISLISLITVVLFQGRTILKELEKRFHL